jgi:hypothetical protein
MNARSALRRALRAAAAHDRRPALKALLPLAAPGVEASLDAPGAAPLRLLVAHAARALPRDAPGPTQVAGAAALADVAALLEANLARGRLYARKMREEERRSLHAPGPAPTPPNLAWFFSRMDAATRRAPATDDAKAARLQQHKLRHRAQLAQARAAAGLAPLPRRAPAAASAAATRPGEELEEPIVILRQMVAVRCVPPRRMVLDALRALALSGAPGDFERALEVFFFLERATPHLACTACVDALVQGCLEASPPPPPRTPAPVWRALGIAEAMLSTAGLLPSTHLVNRLLETAARGVHDAATLQRCRAAIRAFAAAGVPILEDVSRALLAAAERVRDFPAALSACRQVAHRGGALSTAQLRAMLAWALDENDADAAAWLQAEEVRARGAEPARPEEASAEASAKPQPQAAATPTVEP